MYLNPLFLKLLTIGVTVPNTITKYLLVKLDDRNEGEVEIGKYNLLLLPVRNFFPDYINCSYFGQFRIIFYSLM